MCLEIKGKMAVHLAQPCELKIRLSNLLGARDNHHCLFPFDSCLHPSPRLLA